MVKRSSYKIVLIPIVVFILALVGCGGGGSSSNVRTTATTPPPLSLGTNQTFGVADSIPRTDDSNTITQTSNVDTTTNITTDAVRVEISGNVDANDLRFGASVDVGGTEYSINSDDSEVIDEGYSSDTRNAVRSARLYRDLGDDGQLWLDIYTDRPTNDGQTNSTEATADQYLTGGLFLYQPNDPNADPTVGVFASASSPFPGGVDALAGTATYNGRATGAYADTEGRSEFYSGDISLDADFDATGPGTGSGGSIEGTITDILGESGESYSDVILGIAPLTNENTFLSPADAVTFTDPDSNDYTGRWAGRFAGPSGANPTSVVGTFGAGYSDGADFQAGFLGTFGAYE